MNFTSYLDGMPRFPARDAEPCEIPITVEDIRDAMISYTRVKSPELDGLRFELCLHKPDWSGDLLADVYHNWLLDKRKNNGCQIDNFRPITLLNATY